MKKYVRLYCNTCQRTTDKLVDNTRAVPDRCTITLNCQGRLFPAEYRSNGEITAAPEVGITDWYPRGSIVSTGSTIEAVEFIDTATGDLKQVVLGIKLAAAPAGNATATLNLAARSDTPKEYKQYIYRRETEFSTISGVEDGIAQKTLRFKTWDPMDPDIVEVYLNGAKIEEGTDPDQFQVDDGSANPPAPSNTIKFNTPVLPIGTYQVDVIVSKAQIADVYTLDFVRNQEDPNRTGAWDNVSYVERFNGTAWDKFYLFTLDLAEDTSLLKKDTILYPEGGVFVSGVATIPLENIVFFLARKPFTKVDRYPDISVPLDTLGPDRDYLKYHLVDGALALQVTDTSLTTFFPPSRLTKFDTEGTLKTAVAGEDEQLVVDGSVIVGPDQ